MSKTESTHRVVIAGDLLPSVKNIELFEMGDVNELFGEEIYNLFNNSDCAVVNIEGALTDKDVKQDKVGPILKSSPKTIQGIKKLGITVAALANNHIMDYREDGFFDTIECLKSAGIQYVGAGSNVKDVKTHVTVKVGHKKVCIYNVSESFFNIPTEDAPGANIYDEYLVCNELKELKLTHDYIIVIYHGGAEYLPYPTPMVRKRFHRMADCGADFITAQHTHCIGCEEYYNGAYLLYGQGNFLFARQWTKKMTREGLVLEICFEDGSDNVIINKHRVFVTDRDVLRYSPEQNMPDFAERSSRIDDQMLIDCEYEKVKSADIMNKYLMAFKGQSIWIKIALKIFPNKYKKHLMYTYTKEQIMLNQTIVNQDRRQEDLRYVWNYIIKQNRQ